MASKKKKKTAKKKASKRGAAKAEKAEKTPKADKGIPAAKKSGRKCGVCRVRGHNKRSHEK